MAIPDSVQFLSLCKACYLVCLLCHDQTVYLLIVEGIIYILHVCLFLLLHVFFNSVSLFVVVSSLNIFVMLVLVISAFLFLCHCDY